MTNSSKLILALAFAAIAAQAAPAAARIATNGMLNGAISGTEATGARGLEVLEIRLPQATVEYVTKE